MYRRRRRTPRPLAVLAFPLLLASAAAAQPRPVGPEMAVGASTQPALAVLADGGLAVAWAGTVDGSSTILLRVFGPANEPLSRLVAVGVPAVVEGFGSTLPAVAASADGGIAVAWTGPRPGAKPGVFLRRFTADAAPLGEQTLVSGDGPDPAHEPALAAAVDGRLAVSWTVENPVPDGAGDGADFSDVWGRLLAADGMPEGPPFQLNAGDFEEQGASDVVFAADGTLVAVWQSWQGEHFYEVFRRRFSAAGEPLEDDQEVDPPLDEPDLWDHQPRLAAATGGGYVVVWVRSEGNSRNGEVRARAFGADGVPAGGVQVLGGGEGLAVHGTDVAPRPNGGAVAAWSESCAADACPPVFPGTELLMRVLDAAGAPVTAPARLPATAADAGQASLAAGAGGALAAAWTRFAGDGVGVFARRLESPCVADAAHLCLLDDRVRVSVDWREPAGGGGSGVATERGDAFDHGWGTFWFFRPSNPEVAVKVLHAGAVNGRLWVFRASLSNVAYTLTAVDTVSGRRLVLHNPPGTLASSGDTTTLPASDPEAGGAAHASSAAPPPPPTPSVRRGTAPLTPPLFCGSQPTFACLHERFSVSVRWRDFAGRQGQAQHGVLTGDAVYFWFFRPGNPEVFLKVLDGRAVNGRWWVFWGGLSNLEYTIDVVDTLFGTSQLYVNPLGAFGSGADTLNFPD